MITKNQNFSPAKQITFQGKQIPAFDKAKKIIQDPVARQRAINQGFLREKVFIEKAQVTLKDVPEVIKEDAKYIWEAIKDFFNGNKPKGPGGGGGGGGKYEDVYRAGKMVTVPIPVPVKKP